MHCVKIDGNKSDEEGSLPPGDLKHLIWEIEGEGAGEAQSNNPEGTEASTSAALAAWSILLYDRVRIRHKKTQLFLAARSYRKYNVLHAASSQQQYLALATPGPWNMEMKWRVEPPSR